MRKSIKVRLSPANTATQHRIETTMKTTIEITARAKAFSSEGIRNHRFQVDGETVRVWDKVAGHFTTCHSLSKSAIRRIRRMA